MTYEEARDTCHVRSAIYRTSKLVLYWKNHTLSLDDRVPENEKTATDWSEHDPRDSDDTSLFMFND